jgi:hypothetical protein
MRVRIVGAATPGREPPAMLSKPTQVTGAELQAGYSRGFGYS